MDKERRKALRDKCAPTPAYETELVIDGFTIIEEHGGSRQWFSPEDMTWVLDALDAMEAERDALLDDAMDNGNNPTDEVANLWTINAALAERLQTAESERDALRLAIKSCDAPYCHVRCYSKLYKPELGLPGEEDDK